MKRALLRQAGAALIVALMMLIAVLVLGMSASGIALQSEKAARNDRDRQIGLQAAEAALLDAEIDLENSPDAARSRSHLFAHDRAEGFVDGCAQGSQNVYQGLCTRAATGAPAWLMIDFLDQSGRARSVAYGRFTGQTFQTGQGSLPARLPRYIIEILPYTREGEGASAEDLSYIYRITAVGFGMRESTQIVLQTFYRKHGV
jgi:type IV pilus assembly protein PilX